MFIELVSSHFLHATLLNREQDCTASFYTRPPCESIVARLLFEMKVRTTVRMGNPGVESKNSLVLSQEGGHLQGVQGADRSSLSDAGGNGWSTSV